MYDRRLDAVVAAAQTGSFAKAGRRLHVSTPAIAKQVTTFEREYGIVLFDRSRSGVTLTPAGEEFVGDARTVMRRCGEILDRARRRGDTDTTPVRLGVSMLRPGRRILDLWQRDAGRHPQIRLELVSLPDDKQTISEIVTHLGETVDMISTAFDADYWGHACGTLALDFEPFCLAVPRGHALSRRPVITFDDLVGARIRILARRRGGDDTARELLSAIPGVTLTDIDHYDLDTFNDAADAGDLLVSKPMWDGVHPLLVNVPVAWPEPVGLSYGLLYPREPSPAVAAFVRRIAELAGVDCASPTATMPAEG